MKGYYKVPFRQVYCESFLDCIGQTIYCLVWLKVAKHFLPKLPEIG